MRAELRAVADAKRRVVAAEVTAAARQADLRAKVQAAFDKGATGPAVSAILGVSTQRAYQIRDQDRRTG